MAIFKAAAAQHTDKLVLKAAVLSICSNRDFVKHNAILVIDASSSPSHAALVVHDNGRPVLRERECINCTPYTELSQADLSYTGDNQTISKTSGNEEEETQSVAAADGSAGRDVKGPLTTTESFPADNGGSFFDVTALRLYISRLAESWSNSVLILPPVSYFSFNLDLPARDRKTLKNLILMQSQDLLPFDPEDFFFGFESFPQQSGKLSDVHVSAMPREFIRKVLAECRSAGFEPVSITTPSSVLSGTYRIIPESFDSDSAVTLIRPNFSALLCQVNGHPRIDRILPGNSQINAPLSQLALSLLSCERRYDTRLKRVYTLGSLALKAELEVIIGPEREVIPVIEEDEESEATWSLVKLASLCVAEERSQSLLTNFRSGEFSYSPQVKEILKGATAVLPFLLVTAFITIIALLIVYLGRSYRIESLRSLVQQEIRQAVPDLVSSKGNEVQALQIEMRRLSDELNEMGSPTKLSPVDALVELSRDFRSVSAVSLKRLRIQGTRVHLSGNAPDYSAVEQLERVFKRRRDVYCRVRKDTAAFSAGQGDKRPFTLEVILCE